VNYPLAPDLTRITEFKHILGDTGAGTTIVLEYPQDYDKNDPAKNIPYYPVFTIENQQRYQQYQALAAEYPQLVVLGRLAEYKYFNMDDAVANALAIFQSRLAGNC
jgi:UDP-galactopyranose mutase